MKQIAKLAASLTFVLALAACGGNADVTTSSKAAATSEANATDLVIKAANWEFDQAEYKVTKGEPINFIFDNISGYHEVKIKELGIHLKEKGSNQYTITEAGTYTIVCSVPCGNGHLDMKSKLIVE